VAARLPGGVAGQRRLRERRLVCRNLFIDQDPVRTLVEVTGSSDSRIRRQVVAQTLDYAANAVVYWNDEKLRSVFELRRAGRGVSPEDALHDHVGRRSTKP
jgi:hypothetical protein